MGSKSEQSSFCKYLIALNRHKFFFDPLAGNNGDTLILLGAKKLLKKTNICLVDNPSLADYVLLNGGGAMNDLWGSGIKKIEYYRTRYPDKPIIVGPSSFFIEKPHFKNICELCSTGISIFLRESFSEKHLQDLNLPSYVSLYVSHDLAFELEDDPLILNLRKSCKQEHILIAIRKDKEGKAKILSKVKGKWFPNRLRHHLSKMRDALVSWESHSEIDDILIKDSWSNDLPKIRRDVSGSVSFDIFIDFIARSALIITDRLHVAILGYLLKKQVRLLPGNYHKIEGVFHYSMDHPGSSVTLYKR